MTGPAEVFAEYRSMLFTIAYEILGSAVDAEDAVQDSYLRWNAVRADEVENPRSYLARIVTRVALNQLRSSARRREEYVGSWLPEPIRVDADAASDVVLAESISMAMLLVLETLGPDERAVFVLREVFGFEYREIARCVGRTEASARQVAHRAREHVQARRRRFDPDPVLAQQVAEAFLAATLGGDVQALMDLLAPDVVEISDGGGKVSAARRPVVGRERVARYLSGLVRIGVPQMRLEPMACNAMPAVAIYSGDRLDCVLLVEVADALVSGVYIVRNPDKLAAFARSRETAR
ncbi:RNA polymerase sigma-70 factor [Rhodococcus sp. D2-41]|uniref:RNA polymerase sigma-70 factor n=1 Tax=Speluncibacter jeojiensis TaxID=2710754 RepID=UPI00240F3225|nr:RNA polymerase sigma-70 factor [Rhodococcus sp. D2-41]MDG3012739.1 RNA polymerase sigma-70 factor [Rhodococcus sp. D2-41]